MSKAAGEAASRNGQPVDVRVRQVAQVYAKGLLAAAGASADAVVAEFAEFVTQVLDRVPSVERVLGSTIVPMDEKLRVLERSAKGRTSGVFYNFLRVLAEHERLDLLRAIQYEVRELHDRQRGRVRVQVQTAAPLDEAGARSLADGLRKSLGAEPILERSVDAELLGGLVLRIGDMVYDGSIASQLARVRQQMIHRSVHEIQSRRDRFRHPGGN